VVLSASPNPRSPCPSEAIKIGRRILVPRSALTRLVESSQARPAEMDGGPSSPLDGSGQIR